MRLFLYGTLLDHATFAGVVGDRSQRRTRRLATLRGWRVVAWRDTRYPTLIRARACATGVVIEVGPETVRRLQRYEGDANRLRRMTVHVAGLSLPAYAWVARGGTSRGWASAVI